MLFSTFVSSTAAVGFAAASAIPRSYPTNASDQALLAIERQADGKLSNNPPPTSLSPASITVFQVITFNEQLEGDLFQSTIDNITNNVPGFGPADDARATPGLVKVLTTVQRQEQLHEKTAVNILKSVKAPFIPQPCKYKFPTTSLSESIRLASTLTSVVLGTLQDAENTFATANDNGVVRPVASVIGQEGEQNGMYHSFLGVVPSEKPFITASTGLIAFNILQQFIESCPFDMSEFGLTIFEPLNLVTALPIEPKDQELQFSANLKEKINKDSLYITYLVGQQKPISVKAEVIEPKDGLTQVKAKFPFEDNIMQGLSLALLTNTSDISSPNDLNATVVVAGSVPIVVDDKVDFTGVFP